MTVSKRKKTVMEELYGIAVTYFKRLGYGSTVKGTYGQLVEIVPSRALSVFDLFVGRLALDVDDWNAKAAQTISELAIHGGRIAGMVHQYPEAEMQRGTWALVGFEPDGRNCEDCLGLHGTEMTLGEFLDTKFTTRCGGNCRCGFKEGAGAVDPLTSAELKAALDA